MFDIQEKIATTRANQITYAIRCIVRSIETNELYYDARGFMYTPTAVDRFVVADVIAGLDKTQYGQRTVFGILVSRTGARGLCQITMRPWRWWHAIPWLRVPIDRIV